MMRSCKLDRVLDVVDIWKVGRNQSWDLACPWALLNQSGARLRTGAGIRQAGNTNEGARLMAKLQSSNIWRLDYCSRIGGICFNKNIYVYIYINCKESVVTWARSCAPPLCRVSPLSLPKQSPSPDIQITIGAAGPRPFYLQLPPPPVATIEAFPTLNSRRLKRSTTLRWTGSAQASFIFLASF
jgi:hypothetical protein